MTTLPEPASAPAANTDEAVVGRVIQPRAEQAGSDEAAHAVLERRYRRLIACYPAAHRARYEDELLGVLLAQASEGQRSPDPREAAAILWTAMTLRLQGRAAPLWADAGLLAGFLGTLLLLTRHVRLVATELAWVSRIDGAVAHIPVVNRSAALGWLLVLVAILANKRFLAVGAAWLTAGAEAVLTVVSFRDSAMSQADAAWPLVLAGTVAVALTAALALADWPRPARRAAVWFTVACLAIVAAPVVDAAFFHVERFSEITAISYWHGQPIGLAGRQFGVPAAVCYGVAVLLMAIVVARVAAPIRRRVLAFAVPLVATVGVWVGYSLSQPWLLHTDGPPALLVVGPVGAFGLAVLAVQLRELRWRQIP